MGQKVNRSKVRRGWRKKSAKRLNEELKARYLQAENFTDNENTPVASVNVLVVDTSLQNKESSDEPMRVNVAVVDTSLQNEESSDKPMRVNVLYEADTKIYHTLEIVPVPIIPEQNSCLPVEVEKDNELSYSHREHNVMKLPSAEIQELQRLSAIARKQNDPNLSTHHSPADSDQEDGWEDCYIISQEENVEEVRINGNRVVDFMYLFEQLQEISHHDSPFGCNLNHLELIGEKKEGIEV